MLRVLEVAMRVVSNVKGSTGISAAYFQVLGSMGFGF